MRLREDLKAAKAKFKKAEEKHAKGAKQAEELRELTEALGKEVPLLEQCAPCRNSAPPPLPAAEATAVGQVACLLAPLHPLRCCVAQCRLSQLPCAELSASPVLSPLSPHPQEGSGG